MIKHYITIAFRSLAKQKFLLLINVLGLSIGLACFILFSLYAVNEFSFDRFHANADQIYRVARWSEAYGDMESEGDSYMPMPLGPAMKKDLTGVKDFVRIREGWGTNFIRTDKRVSSLPVSFADPQFFSVFSFKVLAGNAAAPIKGLKDIVLTEDVARQLFGEINVIGRTVEIKVEENFEPFVITAVTENPPANSTITFDILANWAYMETMASGKRSIDNWGRSGYQTYIQLQPGSGLPNDKQTLASFRKTYYPDELAELKQRGVWKKPYNPIYYQLQPLKEVHTNTSYVGGIIPPVNTKNIFILLAIAAGILLIACINFTTLAIGRSAGRAKEIGVRKVIGSNSKKLTLQFLTESMVLTLLSGVIGFLLAQLLLQPFNTLSGRELNFSFAQYPETAWIFAGLVLLTGLVSGSYPALVLSKFKPVEVLKSRIRVSGSNLFTKSLVTFQFVLSVVLIISTAIILQQVNYMQNANPGFDKENVLMIDGSDSDVEKVFPLFKQDMLSHSSVAGIASADMGLGEGTGWSRSGFDYNGKHKEVFEYFVDEDYINVLKMQILAGRDFNPSIAMDSQTSIIINETMVKDFGWTNESAIGQKLTGYAEDFTPVIIGVVKDFHFRPFSEKIEPQMFHQFKDYASYTLFVRLKPGNPAAVLAQMQQVWKKYETELPFKYTFLDESLDNLYKTEERWSSIIAWAGGISIFLACLGLFGLAALAAINRTKEIGIRKVLGASISGIIHLLSKDFIKLVALAVLIASPLAWYFMHKSLQRFAYHIDISIWVFVGTATVALLTAFVTIAFQALKAAFVNPVKSLRTE